MILTFLTLPHGNMKLAIITLGGGGNWEFQYYDNNRSNSYVKDGVLYIEPSFLIDDIGEGSLRGGYNLDLWGSQPANLCTQWTSVLWML